MSSEFGNKLRVSLFGESHGKAIGVLIDGLPAGEAIDFEALNRFLQRRRPGQGALTSARQEADLPQVLSGLKDGKTTGTPLCAIIENQDAHPHDYEALQGIPRPSHADYGAWLKWKGNADLSGGGHFSGRLTAPLCVAGGIALQLLMRHGIAIGAHLFSVSDIRDMPFPEEPDAALFSAVASKAFPVLSDEAGEAMQKAILEAAAEGDSVGGIIECAVTGLPGGLGGPLFDGMDGKLALALYGIPAVKGVEFGSGFGGTLLRGSQNNDPFIIEQGKIKICQNNAGGILGGITTGAPLLFRVAVKPTPSIAAEQSSVDWNRMEQVKLLILGRHDPCIALRAVPVVEAAAACVLLDALLEEGLYGN